MQSKKTIKIGASAGCDVVMDQDTVSGLHCTLTWRDGRWYVRDEESTNGTFVNGERILDEMPLKESDQLTLGRGVQVPIPDSPKNSYQSREKNAVFNVAPGGSGPSSIFPSWLIGALCLGLLLTLVGVLFFNRPGDDSDTAQSSSAEATSSSDAEKPWQTRDAATDKTSETTLQATATESNPDQREAEGDQYVPLQKSETTDSAVWALLAESKTGERRLLGTAIAITPRKALTLASIVDAVEMAETHYPRLLLMREVGTEIDIIGSNSHPDYKKAEGDLIAFRNQLDAKLSETEPEATPTLEESLDWSERLNQISRRLEMSDLAILEVATDLESLCPVESSKRNDGNCRLTGYPAIAAVPTITDGLTLFKQAVEAQLEASKDEILQANFVLPQVAMPVSLACIDENGRLIGLCAASEAVKSFGSSTRIQIIPVREFWK